MLRKTLIAAAASAAALTLALPAAAQQTERLGNVVETAAAVEQFSTLAAAIEAAGLTETLAGEGPFTVFAPTDAAFAALPAGTLDSLLLPENQDQLVQILTYHVVPGEVMSTDLTDGMTAETVNGAVVTIGTTGGVTVDQARVTQADVEVFNGVIHVIDTVMLPG